MEIKESNKQDCCKECEYLRISRLSSDWIRGYCKCTGSGITFENYTTMSPTWCPQKQKENQMNKYESILEELYYEKLHWCDCGCPEISLNAIKNYLSCLTFNSYTERREAFRLHFGVDDVYDEKGLLLCLAYTLDGVGLTDHGSSIGHAWLTNYGKDVLKALELCEDLDIFS